MTAIEQTLATDSPLATIGFTIACFELLPNAAFVPFDSTDANTAAARLAIFKSKNVK